MAAKTHPRIAGQKVTVATLDLVLQNGRRVRQVRRPCKGSRLSQIQGSRITVPVALSQLKGRFPVSHNRNFHTLCQFKGYRLKATRSRQPSSKDTTMA